MDRKSTARLSTNVWGEMEARGVQWVFMGSRRRGTMKTTDEEGKPAVAMVMEEKPQNFTKIPKNFRNGSAKV